MIYGKTRHEGRLLITRRQIRNAPSVRNDDGSIQIPSAGAGHEHQETPNILLRARPRQRDQLPGKIAFREPQPCRAGRLEGRLGHVGRVDARRNPVHADIVAQQRRAQDLGQRRHRCLGGLIRVSRRDLAQEAADRAGEDDLRTRRGQLPGHGRRTPLVGRIQEAQKGHGRVVGPRHVDMEGIRHLLHGDLPESLPVLTQRGRRRRAEGHDVRGTQDARVGDQEIDVFRLRRDGVQRALQGLLGAYVADDGHDVPVQGSRGRFEESRLAASDDEHFAGLIGVEGEGHRAPETYFISFPPVSLFFSSSC